jgi:hypothetical protein
MKDSAKLQYEILVQKKKNIEKNILNIQKKHKGLQESLLREKQALSRVNKTLELFGKPSNPKENKTKNLNSQENFLRSSAFSEKSL